jgi:hypothetical protein
VFVGNFFNKAETASSPPVEAPMATTGKEFFLVAFDLKESFFYTVNFFFLLTVFFCGILNDLNLYLLQTDYKLIS